jgi:hypothetical protein
MGNGGLMQIIEYGMQDINSINNPEINFFKCKKTIYEKQLEFISNIKFDNDIINDDINDDIINDINNDIINNINNDDINDDIIMSQFALQPRIHQPSSNINYINNTHTYKYNINNDKYN